MAAGLTHFPHEVAFNGAVPNFIRAPTFFFLHADSYQDGAWCCDFADVQSWKLAIKETDLRADRAHIVYIVPLDRINVKCVNRIRPDVGEFSLFFFFSRVIWWTFSRRQVAHCLRSVKLQLRVGRDTHFREEISKYMP